MTAPPPEDKQPICWEDIECAIHDWVTAELVFDAGQVIWLNQNIPQPKYPYVDLLKSSVIKIGIDETIYIDEGQPVTMGPREFTLSINAWGCPPETAALDLQKDGFAMGSTLQSSLSRPAVLSKLSDDGGLSVVEELAVIDNSALINGRWVSRGTLDVRFRTTSVMSKTGENTGIIDKAELESTELGVDILVDAS